MRRRVWERQQKEGLEQPGLQCLPRKINQRSRSFLRSHAAIHDEGFLHALDPWGFVNVAAGQDARAKAAELIEHGPRANMLPVPGEVQCSVGRFVDNQNITA